MGSANERRCYNAMPSLIGWDHIQNSPCVIDQKHIKASNSYAILDLLSEINIYQKMMTSRKLELNKEKYNEIWIIESNKPFLGFRLSICLFLMWIAICSCFIHKDSSYTLNTYISSICNQIDRLVQERRHSIAKALESRLSCTNLSKYAHRFVVLCFITAASSEFCSIMEFICLSFIIAWSAPSHYLNQWWIIVNWNLWRKLRWNWYIFIQGNTSENVVLKMSAILSRPQCDLGPR